MENNNIINKTIDVKENLVKLTETKLKAIAMESYEKGRIKLEKIRFRNLYRYLFSVAGTLLFSFFTAEYNPIGNLSAEQVTACANVLFVVILLAGIFSFAQHRKVTSSLSPSERDLDVNKIIKDALGGSGNEEAETQIPKESVGM